MIAYGSGKGYYEIAGMALVLLYSVLLRLL
jgi:hypothetical protein